MSIIDGYEASLIQKKLDAEAKAHIETASVLQTEVEQLQKENEGLKRKLQRNEDEFGSCVCTDLEEMTKEKYKLQDKLKVAIDALERLINSEVVKNAEFIEYSEAYSNAQEVLEKIK